MSIGKITYTYDKKSFRKALLRHIMPITILTFGQCFLILFCGILAMVGYAKNNRTLFIAMEIPTIVFVFSAGLELGIYKMAFQNLLINVHNWPYQHELAIENNQVSLSLRSQDGSKDEKYSFTIKKIKKEKDNYLIFKNSNHFIYVPAELLDASKVNP